MFGLTQRSSEVTKFKVHDIYLLTVTKHLTHLEGPNEYGNFHSVLVETAWELELSYITLEEGKLLCSCRSQDWGDLIDQEGPWSVPKALHWMECNLGPED